MLSLQVTCIKLTDKKDDKDSRQGIAMIGGVTEDTPPKEWKLYTLRAIERIEEKTTQFWVDHNGVKSKVIVAKRDGHKYLKTEHDGYEPNNLLSLPLCPELQSNEE